MTSDGLYISRFIWQVIAYIYQRLYDKWWLILSGFIWQLNAYIYQGLYEKWSLIYIYQGLNHKWWLIYIKIYMTSDGLYISRFIYKIYIYTLSYKPWYI